MTTQCQWLGSFDVLYVGGADERDAARDADVARGDRDIDLDDGGQHGPGDGGCGSHPGPTMVAITKGEAGTYCIDSTEVTNAEFDPFLDDVYARKALIVPKECETIVNVDVQPPPKRSEPGKGAYPRADVNFCYAWAYCKWAGKRLCGRIGGGTSLRPDFGRADPGNEWDYACNNGLEGTDFSYGRTFDQSACSVDGDAGFRPPKSKARCRGMAAPFDAIFDMSGNVPEYIDIHQNDDTYNSTRLTGGFYSDSDQGGCGETRAVSNDSSWGGIRCCANPL